MSEVSPGGKGRWLTSTSSVLSSVRTEEAPGAAGDALLLLAPDHARKGVVNNPTDLDSYIQNNFVSSPAFKELYGTQGPIASISRLRK